MGSAGVDGVMYVGVHDTVPSVNSLGPAATVVVDEVESAYTAVIVVVSDDCFSVPCPLCGEGMGAETFDCGILSETGCGCTAVEGGCAVTSLPGICSVEATVVCELSVVCGSAFIAVDVCPVKLSD